MVQQQSLGQRGGGLAACDPLAARLLPVLMHRMNNATQLLSNLHAMQQYSEDTDWLQAHCKDLAECSRDIEHIGYLLAVLASASGADLLLERREKRGVHIMVVSVLDAVRRDGGELVLPTDALPDQSSSVHAGWELPWAIGSLLYNAAQPSGGREASPLEWQLVRDVEACALISKHVPEDQFGKLRPRLETLLPEAKLEISPEGWSWRVPADWFNDPPKLA